MAPSGEGRIDREQPNRQRYDRENTVSTRGMDSALLLPEAILMPHWADNFKLRWKDHTPLGCGTAIGWRRGCHCEECREWHRKSVAEWRAGGKALRMNARVRRIRALSAILRAAVSSAVVPTLEVSTVPPKPPQRENGGLRFEDAWRQRG